MTLAQTQIDGHYYDAERYATEQSARELGTWYIGITGPGDDGEEIDVLARDRREAFRVIRAAIERDYADGVTCSKVVRA